MTYITCPFEEGDSVKAVPHHEQHFLTSGRTYEVLGTEFSRGMAWVTVLNDMGVLNMYYAYRFELITKEETNDNPNETT